MKRFAQFACFATLIALVSAPVYGAGPASVSGLVRDSAGVPQIGAEVQLLRADLSVATSVYTDSKGRFLMRSVMPGRYGVKAICSSFLPSLRENVRVHSSTIVNLTLNTLYEAMQWLPSQPRSASARKDDWDWTLRSAADRPLLRWLENGPLVVVTDGPGAQPRLKARIVATGEAGTFGESGERISVGVEETPSESRELLASVDFAPNTDGWMESMLGFRQDLGFAGSVQSVAAVAIHPEVESAGGQGVQEATVSSSKTINFGPSVDAEVGTAAVLARFADQSAGILAASLPFATVAWHDGPTAVHYRMATTIQGGATASGTQAAAWLPNLTMREGSLVMERGLHQEIGWERRTDASGMSLMVYNDRIENPVVEGAAQAVEGSQGMPFAGALLDSTSGLVRGAGSNFTSTGLRASVERSLPGGNRVRLTYANGDALVIPAAMQLRPAGLMQILAASHPRHAQMYSLSLSGTLEGTRTRWRATYRWQPEDTVTAVAPFDLNGSEPYFNLHVRQPFLMRRDGVTGFEALVDVQNLLAQGYRPYLLPDGSVVIFAQGQRALRAGLAFTF